MQRILLISTLLACILVQLSAQDNQYLSQPEMEFARMRELAGSGHYQEAKQIGYALLDENAEYHDVALYLARILGWESNFDSAYMILDRVIEMDPGLYEAYATCVDLAYWENNLVRLDSCAGRAYQLEPDSTGAFDRYRTALQQGLIQSTDPELFAYYSFDHFSVPYVRNWHMLTLGGEIPIKYGTLIPYINGGVQAGEANSPASDIQMNLDAYLTLGKLNYALLAYGFSPNGQFNYFPGHRAAGELWQALPLGFGVSAGFRYFYWDQNFTFLTFTAEKYAGNYWFSLRNYLFFKDYGVSGSYYLSARRYFENRFNYLTLTLGYGTAPDEPIDVISDLDRLNAVSCRIQFSRKLTPGIRLDAMAGYAWEEYAAQEYRNRIDVRIGAYFVIKK